jgi:signal transduction histidine kinase
MSDLILKASVGAVNFRDRAVSRVREMSKGENGDIVQTIIIIAIFVLVCVVVGGLLATAINGQGQKVADCIGSVNGGKCTDFTKINP